MTLKELIAYYGNSWQFQLRTGMSHSNVVNWEKQGYIPLGSQRKIEALTDGALVVRFEDLGLK